MNLRAAVAMVRASWLSSSSYKIGTVISMIGVCAAIVPVYFISQALQPMMADVIRGEGHQYFGFLLLGTITFSFLPVAIRSLPSSVGGAIGNGTLEMILATPTSLPVVLAGMMGYGLLWTAVRSLLLVLAGTALGAVFDWPHVPAAIAILGLTILAHVPLGLMAAASIVAFRTAGPFPQVVLVLSSLLGGVYYPTHVVPAWLEQATVIFPLTYGLRALRRVLLEGAPFGSVLPDIGILLLFVVTLFAVGTWAFTSALGYARRNGALSHY